MYFLILDVLRYVSYGMRMDNALYTDSWQQHVDKHIGSRLRYYRQLRRLSMSELARRVDLTFQQVQKYETGSNRISVSRLLAFAEILDVPVMAFFPVAEQSQESEGMWLIQVEALLSELVSLCLKRPYILTPASTRK